MGAVAARALALLGVLGPQDAQDARPGETFLSPEWPEFESEGRCSECPCGPSPD